MKETASRLAAPFSPQRQLPSHPRLEVLATHIAKAGSLLCAAFIAATAGTASAHVIVQPNEAAAGSYFQMAFVVPHGCNGKATVALRVKPPDGVTSVKPQMKPGWSVEIKMRKLDAPQRSGHAGSTGEAVDEVSWLGGALPDNLYDSFGLMMKLPDSPNTNLYFPVVQECEEAVRRWTEIPEAGKSRDDLREPAPLLRLKPAVNPMELNKMPDHTGMKM